MGLRKGQAPEAFKQGKLKGKGFESRTPEEMKEIVRKSVETRRRNREERMALQKCMRELLKVETPLTRDKKKFLESVGLDKSENVSNQVLLMVSLFKSGMSGDTQAIKQIVDMMDKLDLFEETGEMEDDSSVININISHVKPKERTDADREWEEEEIRRAENGMSLPEEEWE